MTRREKVSTPEAEQLVDPHTKNADPASRDETEDRWQGGLVKRVSFGSQLVVTCDACHMTVSEPSYAV